MLAARKMAGPRKKIKLPKEKYDEVVFFGTTLPNVFILDCIKNEEREQVSTVIRQMTELDFETMEHPCPLNSPEGELTVTAELCFSSSSTIYEKPL